MPTGFRVHQFARIVAGFAFLLVIAGGLVTSTSSGLAVPDWPLSYGQVFPPMVGGIRFEHAHRVIAGVVAILTLLLALWLQRSASSSLAKRLGWAALGAVVLQELLGGATVLRHLPPAVSIAHACLGQVFFSLVVSAAVTTSAAWRAAAPAPHDDAARLHRLAALTTIVLGLQLAAGASLRHTGAALGWHLALAGLVVIHVLLLGRHISFQHQGRPLLMWPLALLVGLLVTQLALGVGALLAVSAASYATTQWSWWPVALRTAHVAVGAALLATSCVVTVCACRLVLRVEPATAVASVGAGAA